ncbi:MAG: nickel-dependent hydrogenase large subunit [Propionibacteriaceae bacterium]|nr:nickel-dependent hydrogenase large subunit [Propionibacteriaceae bacterium]
MIQHVDLSQVVDAAPARVVVTRDTAGEVTDVGFDLSGLPRVDAMLVGRPVIEVPALVERLCGICPAAHHLAGVRALEALAGCQDLPPTATAVRRLLHYASVISIHATSLIVTHQDEALALRRFAKAVMTAAGSPGHFPTTAVPGGVVAPVDRAQRDLCIERAATTLPVAQRLAELELSTVAPADLFGGADVALVDADGHVDLFGEFLRATAGDGTVVIAGARAEQWDELVTEAVPGSPAPRPYLKPLGSGSGAYRVGPVAQLRVGVLPTPVAASFQQAWRESGGGAASARAIVTVHAIEVIAQVLGAPGLDEGPVRSDWLSDLPAAVGVGWVDGARGLLVHRYATTADGRVAAATILTPTAQNEPWLGELLRAAVGNTSGDESRAGLEEAIHEADPCLPCSSAPAGAMDLVVDTVSAGPAVRGA